MKIIENHVFLKCNIVSARKQETQPKTCKSETKFLPQMHKHFFHERNNYGKCIETNQKWNRQGSQTHQKSIEKASPKMMENWTPE